MSRLSTAQRPKRPLDRKHPEMMKRAFGCIRLLEYYLKMSIETDYADWKE
jgi:hypothetical protein